MIQSLTGSNFHKIYSYWNKHVKSRIRKLEFEGWYVRAYVRNIDWNSIRDWKTEFMNEDRKNKV